MASSGSYGKLLSYLSAGSSSRAQKSSLLPSPLASGSSSSSRPSANHDTKSLGLGLPSRARPLQFGSPAEKQSKAQSSASGTDWTKLLQKAATGGAASVLGGTLGSLGLGSVVSGILHLFGGGKKAAPPPLTRFTLPSSQERVSYVRSPGSVASQTGSSLAGPPKNSTTGSYQESHQPSPPASPSADWLLANQGAVAQAVKEALLNSHSLHDVIVEI